MYPLWHSYENTIRQSLDPDPLDFEELPALSIVCWSEHLGKLNYVRMKVALDRLL